MCVSQCPSRKPMMCSPGMLLGLRLLSSHRNEGKVEGTNRGLRGIPIVVGDYYYFELTER